MGVSHGGDDELVIHQSIVCQRRSEEPNGENVDEGGAANRSEGSRGDRPSRVSQNSTPVGARHDSSDGGVEQSEEAEEADVLSGVRIGLIVASNIVVVDTVHAAELRRAASEASVLAVEIAKTRREALYSTRRFAPGCRRSLLAGLRPRGASPDRRTCPP